MFNIHLEQEKNDMGRDIIRIVFIFEKSLNKKSKYIVQLIKNIASGIIYKIE